MTGTKILSQIGSSFRAQLSYSPTRELDINSKLYFYTNYEKIEVDWEIVGDFKFNRFLSIRLSLNPDTTTPYSWLREKKPKYNSKNCSLLVFHTDCFDEVHCSL